jgi:hypothetical protein
MCDKCDGRGIVYDVVPGYDWYGTGGFDYEAVVETNCDCEAGDAERLRDAEDAARRQREWETARGAAEARGEEFIPF